MKHSFLLVSLAALAIGGTASAQDRDQNFRNRDSNGDGVLTQGEYGGHPGNFRSLDVNGDGVLSYEEFVRRGGRVDGDQGGFADPFSVMDSNNDNVISTREWNGDRVTFRRMDDNNDGVISRREYRDEPVQTGGTWQRFRDLDRNNDRVLSRREAGMSNVEFRRVDADRNGVLSMGEFRNQQVGYTGGNATDEFRSLDRNGNGTLSRSEANMSRSDFDRADDDNDGVLTFKEFRTYGGNYRDDDGGFFGSILGRVQDRR